MAKYVAEKDIKKYIIDNYLDIVKHHLPPEFTGIKIDIKREYTLTNNIKVDIAFLDEMGYAIALFEVKSDKVGVHEVMTGIGQTKQYIYHMKNNINYPVNKYHKKCKVFLATGKGIQSKFDWNTLRFEKYTNLLIIDSDLKTTTEFNIGENHKDKKKLNVGKMGVKTTSISSFYFRDNRLIDYYLTLKLIYKYQEGNGYVDVNRVDTEFRKIMVKRQGNCKKNVFITLRGIGALDSNNTLTPLGYKLCHERYSDFCQYFYKEYMYPYVNHILVALINMAKKKNETIDKITFQTLYELNSEINALQNNHAIQYLTDCKTKYTSSWLCTLEYDLCILERKKEKGVKYFKINYLPFDNVPFKLHEIILANKKAGTLNEDHQIVFDWLDSEGLSGAE